MFELLTSLMVYGGNMQAFPLWVHRQNLKEGLVLHTQGASLLKGFRRGIALPTGGQVMLQGQRRFVIASFKC